MKKFDHQEFDEMVEAVLEPVTSQPNVISQLLMQAKMNQAMQMRPQVSGAPQEIQPQ